MGRRRHREGEGSGYRKKGGDSGQSGIQTGSNKY